MKEPAPTGDAPLSRQDHQGEVDAQELARRLRIGEFVRRELKRRGWTQGRLAKKAGCDQTTISKTINAKHRVSDETLSLILEAFELPLDSIDQLPGLGFDAGSHANRLKLLIIRALVAGDIPSEDGADARGFIEDRWNYPAFRDMRYSRNEGDAVWSSLVADNYFQIDDDGHYVPAPMYYDLKGNLLLYIAAMASAMSRVRDAPLNRRPKAIADFDEALRAWGDAINHPDKLTQAIDAVAYGLAASDRMMLTALLGHAAALKFFVEVGTSVAGAEEEHYVTIVRPFLLAILDALVEARDKMVSDAPNPTGDLMASLSRRIDLIFDRWRASGMLSLPDDKASGPPNQPAPTVDDI